MNIDYSLYLVTDRNLTNLRPLDEVVEKAIQGGVKIVQIREKNSSTRDFLELATKIHKITSFHHIPLVINDRIDVAQAMNAEGVHLGQSDMPYPLARKILGREKIIGISVETIEQVEEANVWDMDYLGVSPIFTTSTKPELEMGIGIAGLRKFRKKTKHVLVGIGGINIDNSSEVLEAGADGLAVVSAICEAKDIKSTCEEFSTIIQIHKEKRKNELS